MPLLATTPANELKNTLRRRFVSLLAINLQIRLLYHKNKEKSEKT
jgi:hypothetical protein